MAREPDSLVVRRAVDRGEIPPVWLWSGPEDFLKEELFGKLAERVAGEGMGALNVNRYRAGDDSLDEILATCRTLPMLSARRAVLVKDLEKLGKTERESLLAYAADPAPETALVLAGERHPGDSFHKALGAAGAVPAVFWVPFEPDTRKWIQIRFRDHGKRCDSETAQELLEVCGGGGGNQVPLREVAPEIEKVALAVGERELVTADDLSVIARKADEKLLYAVTERVTARDLAGALRSLDGALLFKDNTEVRIVANLTYTLVNIAKVRDFLDAGLAPREAQKAAGIWPKIWPEIERAARRYDRRSLARGLDALARADRILKSSPRNPRTVLEETLLTICA
jgi:DNA polymerase-3 subunit delta